jgi:predicted dehydrogenase
MLMSTKLKVGFIGAGRVADVHYAALQSCSDIAQLVAFCDVREEAVSSRAKEWNVPGFNAIEGMLSAVDLDAVVVLLPHDMHLEVMEICLARKLPVLLEKPLATNMAEAERIVRLVKAADVPVLVGHNGLFHPAFDQLAQFINEGWIGKPLMGSARSLQWLDFKPWDFRRSKEQTGGGAWVDCAGHLIYRLNAILGEVQDVAGFTSHLARNEMEGEDSAAAVIRYPSGVIAQVAVSYGCKLPDYEKDWPTGCEQMLMLSGDKGMVEYHICPTPLLKFYTELPGSPIASPGVWTTLKIKEPFEVSFDRQMRHFLECVLENTKPRVTAQDAFYLLKTLLSLYDNNEG